MSVHRHIAIDPGPSLLRLTRLILAGVQESLLRQHHAAALRGNSDPGPED